MPKLNPRLIYPVVFILGIVVGVLGYGLLTGSIKPPSITLPATRSTNPYTINKELEPDTSPPQPPPDAENIRYAKQIKIKILKSSRVKNILDYINITGAIIYEKNNHTYIVIKIGKLKPNIQFGHASIVNITLVFNTPINQTGINFTYKYGALYLRDYTVIDKTNTTITIMKAPFIIRDRIIKIEIPYPVADKIEKIEIPEIWISGAILRNNHPLIAFTGDLSVKIVF